MKRFYTATALVGGLATALAAQALYAPLAREAQRLLAAGDPTPGVGALASQAWVGPSLLIPGLALLIGIVAGWLATRGGAALRWAGARAGLAAGFGALIAATLVCAALLAALGADPAVQAFVRMSEPHPEARLAADVIPWLGAGLGALLGLAIGAESLAAAIFGGAVVDVVRGPGVPTTAHSTR